MGAETNVALCMGCVLFSVWIGINGWAGYSIHRVMSQDWKPVPGGCVVHGAWIEMHWRQTSCGKHTCTKQFWEYHFEVSSKPEWPRTDACYYGDCEMTSYDSWDDAAWYLNDLLQAEGKAPGCEAAGYEFDDGAMDFVDTDPTNAHLRHGVNCHRPGDPAPGAAAADPAAPPPAPPADPLDYSAQDDQYAASAPPPPPPLAPPAQQGGGVAVGGEGYGYQSGVLGALGLGSSSGDFPGAGVGGGPMRRGPPCECAASYQCFYDAASPQPESSIKMSAGGDPIWGYCLLLFLFGFCPCCALCVTLCRKLGVGPASSGAKFERQYSS